jgi:uncharacterized membrane protein
LLNITQVVRASVSISVAALQVIAELQILIVLHMYTYHQAYNSNFIDSKPLTNKIKFPTLFIIDALIMATIRADPQQQKLCCC